MRAPTPPKPGECAGPGGSSYECILPCQAGCLSVTDGAVGSRTRGTPTSGTGAAAHRSRADASRAFSFKARVGATRWGDRSPGAPWSPAPMESVDRWPLASPDTQIPGGSRPAGAAVRRRVRGVRTPHPRPVCRRPHSARKGGLVEHPACGPVSEGLQWGQLDGHVFASPRCAGGLSRWPGARSPLPVYTQVTSWPLSGGSGPPGLGVPTVSVEPVPGVVTKLSG